MTNNTYYKFTLSDGTTVELTLAFYLLYQLKAKKKSLYDRYCTALKDSSNGDELAMATIIYTAYCCGNLGNIDECMSEIEFLKLMPDNRKALMDAYNTIAGPKKK